jgi:hypothetical protein
MADSRVAAILAILGQVFNDDGEDFLVNAFVKNTYRSKSSVTVNRRITRQCTEMEGNFLLVFLLVHQPIPDGDG